MKYSSESLRDYVVLFCDDTVSVFHDFLFSDLKDLLDDFTLSFDSFVVYFVRKRSNTLSCFCSYTKDSGYAFSLLYRYDTKCFF